MNSLGSEETRRRGQAGVWGAGPALAGRSGGPPADRAMPVPGEPGCTVGRAPAGVEVTSSRPGAGGGGAGEGRGRQAQRVARVSVLAERGEPGTVGAQDDGGGGSGGRGPCPQGAETEQPRGNLLPPGDPAVPQRWPAAARLARESRS